MAVLKIARMGHPVLLQIADRVDDPTHPEIHRLIADMIDTMRDAPGIGLAAPQVHVPLRIVVFYVPGERSAEDEAEDVALTALINPEIIPIGEDMNDAVEGCLSLPQMAGRVRRYSHIRYSGVSPDGSKIEREANGFHARVVQHECDHLDGILYPMRMDDLTSFGYAEELAKSRNTDAWEDQGEDEEGEDG